MRSVGGLLGYLARVVALIAVEALALIVLAAALPGTETLSFEAALLVAVVMALINALLWPAIARLVLPLTVITFGLASMALSAGAVALAFDTVDGRSPGFLGALTIAFGLALVSSFAAPLLNLEGDTHNLRVVRRRLRGARGRNLTEVPGVIMFEIDGLGEGVLREALRDGYAPTIARWLEQGSHRLTGWECDLSSQTGASQAGLLLGSNWDMPAFRWYEKESGRTLVSNHPGDAAEMERRRSTGAGLLAGDGTSRGNMFSGDAPRCSATVSMIRDRKRSKAGDLFAYFSDPYAFLRTITSALADIAAERWAAARQRRSGAEHVDRGGFYPLIRAAITVVLRDVTVALLIADIVEGVPVSYATFVGYDEVAHHSGIRERDALAVLRRHDRQLARLERAIERAPRPYHLVVLSDHGQTAGRPFRQHHGETLEELVGSLLAHGEVHAPAAIDEAWGDVGAVLADARQEPGMGGRILTRATRSRTLEGTVALGPNREALAERHESAGSGGEAVVLVSGCLGLVYLTVREQRLTLEQIEQAHPRLLAGLAGHPGIGFVMVSDSEDGAIVLGARGSRRLSGDTVQGEDPLAPFDDTAADHLRRHHSFPHCPDILVNAAYDPDAEEVAPFEEFMGSHGGLGGAQTHPFALLPDEWREPEAPIVGVAAMHQALRRWLGEQPS